MIDGGRRRTYSVSAFRARRGDVAPGRARGEDDAPVILFLYHSPVYVLPEGRWIVGFSPFLSEGSSAPASRSPREAVVLVP